MTIAWHAPYEMLKPETRELARAIHSLMEELEAIDWYGQRMSVTEDELLRSVLEHNRDEEKEHAAMVLEWIRRHDEKFDAALRAYLFTSGDLLEIEKQIEEMEGPGRELSGVARKEPLPPPGVPADAAAVPEFAPVLTVGSLRRQK